MQVCRSPEQMKIEGAMLYVMLYVSKYAFDVLFFSSHASNAGLALSWFLSKRRFRLMVSMKDLELRN